MSWSIPSQRVAMIGYFLMYAVSSILLIVLAVRRGRRGDFGIRAGAYLGLALGFVAYLVAVMWAGMHV